ncbi:MAG: hypothetical protein HW388_744 [Dehalococcoidia bacterium]|nr:hypothetical protein [Dehalococcoidia bacterium]
MPFSNWVLVMNVIASGLIVADSILPKKLFLTLSSKLDSFFYPNSTDYVGITKKWIMLAVGITVSIWLGTLVWAIRRDADSSLSNMVVSGAFLSAGAIIGLILTVLLSWFAVTFVKLPASRAHSFNMIWVGPCAGWAIGLFMVLLWLPDAEGYRVPLAVGAAYSAFVLGIVLGVSPTLVRLLASSLLIVARLGVLLFFVANCIALVAQWNS